MLHNYYKINILEFYCHQKRNRNERKDNSTSLIF